MKTIIVGVVCFASSFLMAEEVGFLNKQPSKWRLRVTKDASERNMIYIVDTIADGKFGTEFVVRKGKYGSMEFDAENIYVGTLSDKERDMVWEVFKNDLKSFTLVESSAMNFGESFVAAELSVGTRSIKITFSSLTHAKELSSGLQKILWMAERRLDGAKSK